jgi:hypothetical protein
MPLSAWAVAVDMNNAKAIKRMAKALQFMGVPPDDLCHDPGYRVVGTGLNVVAFRCMKI